MVDFTELMSETGGTISFKLEEVSKQNGDQFVSSGSKKPQAEAFKETISRVEPMTKNPI